ncbi:ZIP family metal transporter [Parvularcula sp. LCG005]|uniref:ZIP family metal transporter n=1 Tax=Parvularcula sp. LCG005 TaxID=3078805 RepID=UPI00294264B7|nr:ZIP family metal transporter [Parvularcula sp. LCG005]WOI53743.1 ZIP family metal transporter [Parvularcula sp. LCG005]
MGSLTSTLPPAVVASLVAALVATLGLVTVLLRDEWATRNRVLFTAFAAGVLVTTALTLFPEALEATASAPLYALLGYLGLYGINLFFTRTGGAIIAPLIAIGLHSYIDGFEYGILFDHDISLGWTASFGLIAHEFAEGVILYSVLRAAGVGTVGAMIGSFIGAAVTTPVGAITSQVVLDGSSPETVGMLLAVASGALLYLGATHLPGHIQQERRPLAVVFYLVGAVLAMGLSFGHTGHEQYIPDNEWVQSLLSR